MKIGLLVTNDWRRMSIDFDGLGEALLRQGHQVVLLCRKSLSSSRIVPIMEIPDEQKSDVAYWRSLDLSAVIFFNWLQAPQVAGAIRASGTRLISRADSDGFCSVRVFPSQSWVRTFDSRDSWYIRLRKTKHWLWRFFWLSRTEDKRFLMTADASDVIVIETEAAKANLERVFKFHRKETYCNRIRVVSHNVSDLFIKSEVQSVRPSRFFCAGRWDDPQKDAPLLGAVIREVLKKIAKVEIWIAGGGEDSVFTSLEREFSQVKWLGRVPQSEIPGLLNRCQFLCSTSRWESQPIGALEALCMGCTFVAPALPGFVSMCHVGRFGTISAKRTAASLAQAVADEMQKWLRGERDPVAIARWWRIRVSSDVVTQEFLALIPPESPR